MATLSAQFRRRTAYLAAALGVLLAASVVAAPAAKANDVLTSPVAVAETYAKPTVPRVLWSRSRPSGHWTRGLLLQCARLTGPVSFQAGGAHGIPAKVSAVTFNLTVTEPRLIGFITAYASGTQRPGSSNVNFLAGQTVANSVTVPVGADGKVTLFNRSYGTTHLIADVSGYYLPGASRNSALTWGDNRFSQLGNGTTPHRSTPAAVSGLRGVKALAGAGGTSYALLSDGTLRAWGSNEYGQLGNGTTSSSTTPVQVSGLTGVTSIAADWSTAYALLKDGTVRSWGSNTSGELGNGSVYASRQSRPGQGPHRRYRPHRRLRRRLRAAKGRDRLVLGLQLGRPARQRHHRQQLRARPGQRAHRCKVHRCRVVHGLRAAELRNRCACGFNNGGQLGNGGGADDGLHSSPRSRASPGSRRSRLTVESPTRC